jgi:outer membrane beta-barrel protein
MESSVASRSTKDTSMKIWLQKRLPLLIGLLVTLAPLAAQAQRESPLHDAPAIRKRLELRDTRLELGAGFGSTLNQDFYHTMFIDVRLGFHLNDWFSLKVFGDFAIDNLATGYQERVLESLPDQTSATTGRDPSKSEAQAAMVKINTMAGGQLEATPFTGKFSLFGKLFAHYDFYGFLGGGVLNVSPTGNNIPDCSSPMATQKYCGVSGIKPAFLFGLGFHTFFNQWLALNVELRDMLASLNPAGRDVNGDGVANADDMTLSHTFSALGSIVVYLPAKADISP